MSWEQTWGAGSGPASLLGLSSKCFIILFVFVFCCCIFCDFFVEYIMLVGHKQLINYRVLYILFLYPQTFLYCLFSNLPYFSLSNINANEISCPHRTLVQRYFQKQFLA